MKSFIKSLTTIFITISIISVIYSCGNQNTTEMNNKLKSFIERFDQKYIPLYNEVTIAYWNSQVTGNENDYARSAQLEYELTKIFADKQDYEELKSIKESGAITDELMKRQLDVLYNAYTAQQIDTAKMKEIIDMQTAISMKFNKFRAIVDGDSLTDNEIEKELKTSTDNVRLEKIWKSSKNSGANVAEDVKTIVKLRNEVAKELGFNNYHEMSLKLSDQDPAEIEAIFDELDSLTRDAFAQLKDEMDEHFAKRYSISKEELKPWHYQNRFFQEAPQIYELDLDKYYKDKNIEEITINYFKGIGMDITDMIAKSDLYEKEGKCQHAFCIDMNKTGDVRVLCNIVDNSGWMNTMLHEYGHAVYSKYTDTTLPFVLRDAAHTFTTEAVAMFFGRLASNPTWLNVIMNVPEEEISKIADDCYKILRLEQLTFSRWAQVMYRFEKSMYEDPDQDLNTKWWELVEKYQLVKKPEGRNEPDWASKIHIATSPCYYHNYLLGEMLASQFTYYVGKNILKTEDVKTMNFAGNEEIGKFFINNVFALGMKYRWNDMIEKATGEKLTAKYYAKQFVN